MYGINESLGNLGDVMHWASDILWSYSVPQIVAIPVLAGVTWALFRIISDRL